MKAYREANLTPRGRRKLALARKLLNRELRRKRDWEDFWTDGYLQRDYEARLFYRKREHVQRAYLLGLRRGYRAGVSER